MSITKQALKTERGVSLIEILVTLLILSFGLLGLAGFMTRLHSSELEAYQRAQALILLNDMTSRINSNRSVATSYITASPLGAGMSCPVQPTGSTTETRVAADLREWCEALKGAAELTGSNKVGAMIGGRGCVASLGDQYYLVTVAWQGVTPIAAPAVTCGQNLYNGATGSVCVNDLCRRVVTTVIRIGNLDS